MKLIFREFEILGYTITLQVKPPTFKRKCKEIEKTINARNDKVAKRMIDELYDEFGDGPEVIRMATFYSFMMGE